MKKALLASIPLLLIVVGFSVGVFASPVMAVDTLAKFEGGIGVIPVSSAAGVQNANGTFPDVNRNVVRGVNPAGQIWVIRKLDAEVKTNGEITVAGEGLVLGGGNSVGSAPTTVPERRVFATLICETAPNTFTPHSSNSLGVPLAVNGNFKIEDMLSPALSDPCPSPVLLIRNAANLGWFAAGILK